MRILRAGVGAISEDDVLLASASEALIIGFNVKPEKSAEATADQAKGRHPPAQHHLRIDR